MSRILVSGLILIGTLLGIRALGSSALQWNMNALLPNGDYPQPRSTGFSTQAATTGSTGSGTTDFNVRPVGDTTSPPPTTSDGSSTNRRPIKGGW